MLICLVSQISAQTYTKAELQEARTQAYIDGYKKFQSNIAPILYELSNNIEKVISSNDTLVSNYEEKLQIKDVFYTNYVNSLSNTFTYKYQILEINGKKKHLAWFMFGYGLGIGTKIVYDFGREQINFETPLINIRF